MGKDIYGNELGKGITQRKWGVYFARYQDSNGVRFGKCFNTVEECRTWIERSVIVDKYVGKLPGSSYTVRSWFQYYIELIKAPIMKTRSIELYTSEFRSNIDPYIGRMRLTSVRPLHCQKVLDTAVDRELSDQTVKKIRSVMRDMFECAFDYGYIASNPVKASVRMNRRECIKRERVILSASEQRVFIKEAKKNTAYPVFAFALQTGVRIGELSALRWKDINFKKKMIYIMQTGRYLHGQFVAASPKTENSKRMIPMTKKCEEILLSLKERYNDIFPTEYKEEGYVFLNPQGNVLRWNYIQNELTKVTKEAGLPRLTMHALRHTFATRCIEAGMRPKTLQVLLGHSSVDFTMNLYVHVTPEQKEKEVLRVEKNILCGAGEYYGT